MAIANLHETLLSYKLRRNAINLEINQLSSQKTLATYSQADRNAIKAKEEQDVRNYFKALYDGDEDLQLQYKDFNETEARVWFDLGLSIYRLFTIYGDL